MIGFPSDSLCPGYKFVQEFGPDEEYEEEEEEVFYVTMELGNIEPTLVPSSDSIRLIGLDTPTPFLQLAGTIFKGSHDLLLGSELLFTEKKDEQDRSKRHLSCVGVTSQRIQFKEVQLRPKTDSTGAADKDSGESSPTEISGYAHGLDCTTGKEAPQKKTRRKGPKPKKKQTGSDLDGEEPAAKPKTKGKKKSGRKGKEKEEDDYDGEAKDETTGEGKSRRTSQRGAKKRKRAETSDGGEDEPVDSQGDAQQSQNLNC